MNLDLFAAYGVELEYMIVDSRTLDVRPVADEVLQRLAGELMDEVVLGEVAWSNELALHVLELKCNGPVSSLWPLADVFQQHVRRMNELLRSFEAQLMPTAMHPWMDPQRELRLWPHAVHSVYSAFDRIFDCSGHGWANLQSVHLNLPFHGDEQFGRLHAAIRLLLPILPALAASSPIVERQVTGFQDTRMEVYRHNARRVPLVSGQVIPEAVFSRGAYQQQLLEPLYAAIRPLDPEGILQHEWLNARGAIARFDRRTIEIRVVDVQECPAADLAICQAIDRVLRALVDERWTGTAQQQAVPTESLAEVLLETIRGADEARIEDSSYLAQLGLPPGPLAAADVWRHLVEELFPVGDAAGRAVRRQVEAGPLSRRILAALESQSLETVYATLCQCLAEGSLFLVKCGDSGEQERLAERL